MEKVIRNSKKNKETGIDAIHSEMIQVEPVVMDELLFDLWALVGRMKQYSASWKVGLLTQVHKKGNEPRPIKYRPVCMLSHTRKIIEGALGNALLRETKLFPRKFGFQRGISPQMTLTDVDIHQGRPQKISTKAYDRLNRSTLIPDCEQRVEATICGMLRACLQPLTVSTKGDTVNTERIQRLGITKGAPLSTIIFLIYIDDIGSCGTRPLDDVVNTENLGNAEMTLTADDVIIHRREWVHVKIWLDDCYRWAEKKGMKWGPINYTVIQEENANESA